MYVYADGSEVGLTTCAPIIKVTESTSEFMGTVCLDVTAGGTLDSYFYFNEFEAAYLLFQKDAAFERRDVEDSSFQESFDQILKMQSSHPDFTYERIGEMKLNKEFVRLYDGNLLQWGEVTLRQTEIDSDESDEELTQASVDVAFHFVVDELSLSIRNVLGDHLPESTEALEINTETEELYSIQLAFFFAASEKINKLKQIQEELVFAVFSKFAIAALVFAICIGTIQIINARRRAQRITKQIIYLYETLEEVVNKREKGKHFQLTYQKSALELNQLHLTFNQVASTLDQATVSSSQGQSKDALLNFSKLYSEFGQFDKNHKHRGVCVANIGSIMLNNGDFIRAEQYLQEAIQNSLNSQMSLEHQLLAMRD